MPWRLIFWFIVVLIEFFLPDSRIRSAYPNRRYNRYYGVFEDDFEGGMRVGNENTGIAASIRQKLRRRNALRVCKNFVKQEKYIITLKNTHVIFVMDTRNKTMSCVDKKVAGRSATVVWDEHPRSQLEEADNEFERIFDSICISFDKNSNYKGILNVLKDNFIVSETEPEPKYTPPPLVQDEEPVKLTSKYIKVIDINSADEKDIARLPGINIITAKRIIKYREEHGAIKDLEELCREFKIKPHFKSQIEQQITFKTVGEKKNKKAAEDRIIDF